MSNRLKLTARQAQVLEFMRNFHRDNDQLPTQECLCARFGWKSPNSALTFLKILEFKGYIERNTLGKFRFTRIGQDPIKSSGPGILALPVVDMARVNGGRV